MKELVSAPWDNKNLIQEWDWLFDNGECVENFPIILGFIYDEACRVDCYGNSLYVKVIGDETSLLKVKNALKERTDILMQDCNEGLCDSNLVVKFHYNLANSCIIVNTFFELD